MKRIVILINALTLTFIVQSQNTLTGHGVITGQGIIRNYSSEKIPIPQEELDQTEAIINRYFFLLNQYAEQVVNNGDFSQSEEELVGLFNTYGEDRDTRVYNNIPLIKDGVSQSLYLKSIGQNLSEHISYATDSRRYITDNISHVLSSIENLIYTDNYKGLAIVGHALSTKYASLLIPQGAYGLPKQILILVSMEMLAIDATDETHILNNTLVFTFRNGKIESIVPVEQTMVFQRAVKLYQNKDYVTACHLLYRLEQSYLCLNAPRQQAFLHSLLSGCWRSHQLYSGYSTGLENLIAELYVTSSKFLRFSHAVQLGNPENIQNLMDSVNMYILGSNLLFESDPFSEGLISASHKSEKKIGYINRLNEWAIPPRYMFAGRFFKGLAPAINVEGKAGLINKHGDYIVEPQYMFLYRRSYNNTYSASIDLKKYGCLNLEGRICVPLIYDELIHFEFDNQYAPCCRNGKWGVVSFTGKEVVPCQYDYPIWAVQEKDGVLSYNTNFQTYTLKL